MTREETVRSLREALDSVDITFPYRCAIVNAIEHLSIQEPESLDEAAEKHVYDDFCAGADFTPEYIKRRMEYAFKAGAEWMAGQGETIDGSLCYDPHLQMVIVFLEDCPKMWEGSIMDVTVQIRKKED